MRVKNFGCPIKCLLLIGWKTAVVNTALKCGRGDEHRFGATRPAQTVDCAGARLGGRVPWGRVNTPTKFGLVGRKSNVRAERDSVLFLHSGVCMHSSLNGNSVQS